MRELGFGELRSEGLHIYRRMDELIVGPMGLQRFGLLAPNSLYIITCILRGRLVRRMELDGMESVKGI